MFILCAYAHVCASCSCSEATTTTGTRKPGQLRLLEVDNRIVVPQGATIKFLITAADVLHSFSVASLQLLV